MIAADFDDGSEEARGDGEVQHQHHDGHQQHDEACQRVHESLYIGDAVDNGIQTMHSGENTVILCGPEEVIDEIAKEAVKALIDEVGAVLGKFGGIETEPPCDEGWGENLGEDDGEMVYEDGSHELFRECACHANICLVRLHFAALEFLELAGEVSHSACLLGSRPMLAEGTVCHNRFLAAAVKADGIFGYMEPFLADITACTAFEAEDAMLYFSFRAGLGRKVARELAEKFVGQRAGWKPFVEFVIVFCSRPL